MSTEIIKKDSTNDWDKIKEELDISGFSRCLIKNSKIKFVGSFSSGRLARPVSITLSCSRDVDLEEESFCDEVYKALEGYFKCNLHLTIYYNDGTELCQE